MMIVVLLFLRECVSTCVCVCVCVAAAARAREEINTIVGLCATCVYFAAGFFFFFPILFVHKNWHYQIVYRTQGPPEYDDHTRFS